MHTTYIYVVGACHHDDDCCQQRVRERKQRPNDERRLPSADDVVLPDPRERERQTANGTQRSVGVATILRGVAALRPSVRVEQQLRPVSA